MLRTNPPFAQTPAHVGLCQFVVRVYDYMAAGLVLTGVAACAAVTREVYPVIFGTPLAWAAVLAPFTLAALLSSRVSSMSLGTAQLVFLSYAGLVGVSLTGVVAVYTGTNIARVFFIAAATFGAMSLYGRITRRDLSRPRSHLVMALFGLVIATVANIFVAASALQITVSAIAIVVFVGLTAWNADRIEQMYVAADGQLAAEKRALTGALALYLDLLNLFVPLMRSLGSRLRRSRPSRP